MISISFLVVIGLWVTVAVILSKRIPRWLGIKKHPALVSVFVFPLVLTAPIADELIGRWQFHRLCEREAVVTLSPDWKKVKQAEDKRNPIVQLNGYVIPIRSQRDEYVDAASGATFVSKQVFHTDGGLLRRKFLFSVSGTTSCWPPGHESLYKDINLQELLKQGK